MWIKVAIYAVLGAAIITMSSLYVESHQHVKNVKGASKTTGGNY